MTSAGIAELKARLSQYLSEVQAGEEVLITDRGRPVARLVAVSGTEAESGRLQRLAREGVVRLPEGTIGDDFWSMERAEDRDSSVRQALLGERASGL